MKLKTCMSAAALSLLTLSGPVMAQSANDDVVVVTATRTPVDASSLPVSLTVIDRDQIELEGSQTLAEALQSVPGLALVQSGPAGSLTSVFIRGTNSKHTLALFDGIRVNDPSSATGVFNFGSDTLGDTGQIEVIRGPLSSLYGSAAIGGVVNIVPREASQPGLTPFAEASIGEFETYRRQVGFDAASDRARGTLTLEHFETAGFDVIPERMSTFEGLSDGGEVTTVSANGSVDLTDRVSLEALIRLREASSEFDTFSGGPTGFQRGDDSDLFSTDDQTLYTLGLRANALNQALNLRARVGQVQNDVAAFNNGARTDVYAAERDFLQLTGSWKPATSGGLIDPVVSFGVEVEEERIDTDTAFNNPLSVSEDYASAFAAAQFGLTDQLTLTTSARLDDYERFGTQTTANIGAVYALPSLNTRLRASYGTSFKAPTLSERFASSAFVTPNPDLDPETGTMAEIGFDTQLDQFAFGAVYFDGEIEDLIELIFDFTTFTGTNQNIAAADLSGVEAYAQFSPVDALTVSLDYTYTEATNTATGTQLLRRPEHSWSAQAVWSLSEAARMSARYTHVGERLDVIYDDDGFFVASGQALDSFGTLDVSGTYAVREDMELFASIKNLLDETYEQPAAFAGSPRAATIGVRWTPGR